MKYFGIIPQRKLWVKIAAIIAAAYTAYHAYVYNNWFYLPFGIILVLATFSTRRQIISKEGVDIIYTVLNHDFHNLWKWEEIAAVHTDSVKSAPNIELHINKGVINRRFIFSKNDACEIVDLIETMGCGFTVSEVNHDK
ncbi:MAG: hypothetical protein SOR72_02780 [Hornefia sp.]|nr:hypothetical protein [Hornefia sp.]